MGSKPPVITPTADSQENNPLRKLAFLTGLCLLFLYITVLPELILYVTNTNTYLLYLFAPPAFLGALITGGFRRTLQSRAAWFWIAFFAWMVLATPFSYWRGGSTARVLDYARFTLPLLFVSGGLAITWKEVRTVFYTIASAGVINLATTRFFDHVDEGGRITMQSSGTIGNSNDLAAHLLLVLPFLLFVVMDKKNALIRYPLVGGITYGVWVITGTASRGALIAMGAVFLFLLWRATPTQRLLGVVALGLMGVIIPLLLPGSVIERLGSLFGKQHIEAGESEDLRATLFRTSLRYTKEHPIFGVGPDQFANYEGNESRMEGQYGSWHATHCSWTQVSAECGIPALIFFVFGLGSALLTVNRTWREARQKGFPEIANACLCYLLGMVGFLVSISFLANAYRFYFPVMIGLAISMRFAAVRQMAQQRVPATQNIPATLVPLAVR